MSCRDCRKAVLLVDDHADELRLLRAQCPEIRVDWMPSIACARNYLEVTPAGYYEAIFFDYMGTAFGSCPVSEAEAAAGKHAGSCPVLIISGAAIPADTGGLEFVPKDGLRDWVSKHLLEDG